MHTTNSSDVDAVTIVGVDAGGADLAEDLATAGYEVYVTTPGTDEPDATATTLEAAVRAGDVIVETAAAREREPDVLARIDSLASPETILAVAPDETIDEGVPAAHRLKRVVELRLTRPLVDADLVEIGRSDRTADETVATMEALFADAAIPTVTVDRPLRASVLERLLLPVWLEAARQVETGTEPAAIDAAIRRLGIPAGPCERLDAAGIDAVVKRVETLRDRGLELSIPSILQELLEEGRHGVTAGEGFHTYDGDDRVAIPRERRYEVDPLTVLAPAIDAATQLLEADVVTEDAVDDAVQSAGWPRGLLEIADEYGLDRVCEVLAAGDREPAPLLASMVAEETTGLDAGEGFHQWDYEATTFGTVRYERRECLAVVTLDRPDVLNALDRESWLGLRRALERADADEAVRATILRGSGRAFSAGDDIAEMAGWADDDEATAFFQEVLGPTVEELRTHSKPTIGVVDGIATGGGCELIVVCDVAVATPDSELGLPEALIGAIPPIAPAYGLPAIGKKDFMELAFTGDRLSGTEAEERGLVNYVVDEGQVEDVARELALATTAASPESVAAIKGVWNRMEDELLEPIFADCLETVATTLQSEAGQEGMTAFLEGRNPAWSGRHDG